MPSPSKLSLMLALTTTAGAFYAGAWFASGLSGEEGVQTAPAERKIYVPAPIPGTTEKIRYRVIQAVMLDVYQAQICAAQQKYFLDGRWRITLGIRPR